MVNSRKLPLAGRAVHSSPFVVLVFTCVIATIISISSNVGSALQQQQNVNRKSLVFDLKTPKVFYCPQEKPGDYQVDKIIVKAQPLDKLCEFEGKHKPKNLPSDCYNDVDESEFACDEKRRFMIKLDLASEGVSPSVEGIDDLDYIMTKSSGPTKKKVSPSGKRY